MEHFMNPAVMILIAMGILLAILVGVKAFGDMSRVGRTWLYIIAGVFFVVGLGGAGIFAGAGIGGFAISGGVSIGTGDGGTDTNDLGGSFGNGGETSANRLAIETLTVNAFQKFSNDQANLDDLLFLAYREDLDPKDPSANPVLTAVLQNGKATDLNGSLMTDTRYRVVLDGNNVAYSKDFGILTFPLRNFNPNTATYTMTINDVALIASFNQDRFTRSNSTDDGISETDVNGQTACPNDNTVELPCVAGTSNNTFTYDESVGDGSYFIDFPMEVTGSQSEIQDLVLCFEYDNTNPPEGNELTEILVTHVTGVNFFADLDTNNLVSFWAADRSCVNLASSIKAGNKGTFRLTFTTTEGNLDANDDWTLVIDDLGSILGKDARLNAGATNLRRGFDAQD